MFPSLTSVASAAANDEPKETPRLSEVLAAFVEERSSQGKWTAKTKLERETAGGVIVELLGDPRVGDVTKEDMRAFSLTIARMPAHVHKRFPGRSLAEVLAAVGDDPNVERLSPVSVNLYLQLTRSLFAWAVKQDMIPQSPAVVLVDHDKGRKQDKRAVFDDADIRQFLDYIGDAGGEPWLWWIPRILAQSGMRLGTVRQGRSGLGLAAQRAQVEAFVRSRGGEVIGKYVEVESGKRNDRAQLHAALKRCRLTRAALVIAKLDRLSRNATFLLTLRDSGARFVAADMPDANELTVGIMALIAEQERKAISERTKAALAAAKARGVTLGTPPTCHGAHARQRRGPVQRRRLRPRLALRHVLRIAGVRSTMHASMAR